MAEENTENTESALIEMPQMNLPAPTEVKEKIHEAFGTIYTKIEEEIAATPVDISTAKGRQALISLAFKISKTKTGLDGSAKGLTDEQKQLIDAINEERREMRETLDSLRDKVRGPVTEWENAEKERVAKVESLFETVRNWRSYEIEGVAAADMNSSQLVRVLHDFQNMRPCNSSVFLERSEEFDLLAATEIESINSRLERLNTEEQERAEFERLKAEQEKAEAERLAREEADRKEKEAAEMAAEAAKIAQAEAQAKIDEEKRRAAEAEARAEAAEKERLATEARAEEDRKAAAKQAEADRVAAEERQKEAERKAAEDAERAKRQAEERAKIDAEAAARKAEEDKQRAIEEERQKARKAELAKKAAEDARAADLEHRRKINAAVIEGIVKMSDVSEASAKVLVQAMSDFKIPHIKIEY